MTADPQDSTLPSSNEQVHGKDTEYQQPESTLPESVSAQDGYNKFFKGQE